MKVLIVGGGIGGMTTALSLHAAGIKAEVFEQAREIREVGTGISALPRAVNQDDGLDDL
jgi:2-polyprenyl-6-methoxyphenol hydroxylase-like FAD-dependent oxidoreductase